MILEKNTELALNTRLYKQGCLMLSEYKSNKKNNITWKISLTMNQIKYYLEKKKNNPCEI